MPIRSQVELHSLQKSLTISTKKSGQRGKKATSDYASSSSLTPCQLQMLKNIYRRGSLQNSALQKNKLWGQKRWPPQRYDEDTREAPGLSSYQKVLTFELHSWAFKKSTHSRLLRWHHLKITLITYSMDCCRAKLLINGEKLASKQMGRYQKVKERYFLK